MQLTFTHQSTAVTDRHLINNNNNNPICKLQITDSDTIQKDVNFTA